MLSQLLFQPRINNLIASLDDSKSMFSVAMRDGVDSSGRVLMEARRNHHGGRERLIEEFGTMLIWGFGINFMKNRVYDPLVRRFTLIKHPALDMDLLLDGPQKLTPEVISTFMKKFPGVYDSLHAVVTKPALRNAYHISNIAKCGVATLPVLLIALGIPTFNQWLTRKKRAEEHAGEPIAHHPQSGLHPHGFRAPAAFAQFSGGMERSSARSSQPGESHKTAPFPGMPQFGGLGTSAAFGVSSLLQNERYNTLLVDGVLSGGRIWKARNPVERAEIIFREGSIVFFLYFAQSIIQNGVGRLIHKLTGTDTGLDFRTIRFLHDRYGQDAARFAADYHRSRSALTAMIPNLEQGLASQKRTGLLKKLWTALKAFTPWAESDPLEALDKSLVDAVRQYGLNQGRENLFFEVAKASGWIHMLKAKHGQPSHLLDLSRKIETGPILHLVEHLAPVAEKAALGGELAFSQLLRKSMAGRFAALVISNAVCAFFLSWLCPRIQHWMTRERTGKDTFPGVA